jgi:hypothetical protein
MTPARDRLRFVRAFALFGLAGLCAGGCSNMNSQQPPPIRISPAAWMGNTRGGRLGATHIVTSSWYGPGYEGKRTASGELFDSNRFTAASRTLPLGSIVKVTNLRNGRSVRVKVNDRGPRSRRRGLDLSPAAAQEIGLSRAGLAPVKVMLVTDPEIE